MSANSSVKKLCLCALCIALCPILPMALHPLGLGSVISPMHIPPLLCGLLVGWPYGLACGLVGPILSHLTSGMPNPPFLFFMVIELGAYGLFSGLLFRRLRTGRLYADLYAALIPAMILGRIAGGAAQAVFFLSTAKPWSLSLFVSSYFIQTAPGAAIHLLLIPALVAALTRAGVVPRRYGPVGLEAQR